MKYDAYSISIFRVACLSAKVSSFPHLSTPCSCQPETDCAECLPNDHLAFFMRRDVSVQFRMLDRLHSFEHRPVRAPADMEPDTFMEFQVG